MQVAWIVTVFDIPCVVFADRTAKARWKVVAALRDAGYVKRGEWPTGMSVRRAPEFDSAPVDRSKCLNPDDVLAMAEKRRT